MAEDESSPPRDLICDDASVELSAKRTSMAFERTAMASDRTLMAMVRTSLALIGFGFTIFQFFHRLNDDFLGGRMPTEAPRRFGAALIVLGMLLLVLGIFKHVRETMGRRARRARLYDQGLIRHGEPVRLSSVLAVAALLFCLSAWLPSSASHSAPDPCEPGNPFRCPARHVPRPAFPGCYR
jgi:putative membrane protein